MSFLRLDDIRRRPWPPVATSVTAAVVVLGLVDLFAGGLASQWLGLRLGQPSLLEFWRPVTFGVLPSGLVGTLLSALFGYWILSTAERSFGSEWTALVALTSTLAVAVVATWFVPLSGILGAASLLGWGVIAGSTYRHWREGRDVRDQLVILAIFAVVNLTGGALSIMMMLAATAGGVAADHLYREVRLNRKPAKQSIDQAYEDLVARRRRQARTVTGAPLVYALCAVLYVLWAVRALMG